MLSLTIDFTALLLSALLVGAMFCVCLLLNPADLDYPRYIVLHQQGIRKLDPALPLLGAFSIVVTLAAAFLARHNKPHMGILIAAAILFIIAGVITRTANMPINASVLRWTSSAPPDNWMTLRDTWWRWHRLRTVSGTVGLALLIIAALARKPPTTEALASLRCCRPLFNALIQVMSLLL
jgi:uncharacterized membrane protein